MNMNVPEFLKNAKSGDIIATKYNDLIMVQRVEISENSVKVYHFFNYSAGKILMNE